MRRVDCNECGVKTEKLDWLASLPRYTQRFALFVGERCRESSLTDVARQTGLHWHTVKDLDKLYMQEQLRRAGPSQPQRIGIDEIALGRHHQYRIVVSDLDAGRPIWFGGIDRSEASLNLFYTTLSPENRAQLKIAVMDMWKAFRKSTLQHAPQTLIIYDKFHILRHLQDAMDKTRRQEYKRLDGDERRYIKGQRYTLLSHWKNLDQEGRHAEGTLPGESSPQHGLSLEGAVRPVVGLLSPGVGQEFLREVESVATLAAFTRVREVRCHDREALGWHHPLLQS